MQNAPIITAKYRRQVGLCWLALLSENLANSFWKPIVALGFCVSIFFLDVLPSFGFWLHIICLAILGATVVYLFAQGVVLFRLPLKADVLARLETNNNLSHQPLRSLDDDLIANAENQATLVLWEMHRAKIAKVITSVYAKGPKPILAKADPYAIRMLVGIILVISVIIAGGEAKDRVMASLLPDLDGPVNFKQIKISAWITPPTYTDMAPVFLPTSDQPAFDPNVPVVEAPIGSLLVIQLSNLTQTPFLENSNGEATAFERDGPNSFNYQQEVAAEDILSITVKDKPLAAWRLFVRPDMPPQVTFTNLPYETSRKALQIAYKAYDDYGVENLTLRLHRPPVVGADTNDVVYEYPIILSSRNRDYIESSFLKDMTPHPWAGTQVLMELIARDAIENETKSLAVLVVLPQREFNHPVARELIKLRTRLVLNPVLDRHKVAILSGDVGDRPENYNYNVAVHLGLRAAALRLIYPSGESETDAVINLLWDLALRLEDGGLSLAETRLRAAQNAVMEALARGGASVDELSRLMDELEHAMADYLQEMVASMLAEESAAPEMAESGDEITPQDLQSMLDRIRELMQMGMKDAAQRMLSEMQKMMENMQAGMPEQSTPQGMEALEMMQGLKDIMQGQRELLERSYQKMQNYQDNLPNSNGQENLGGSSGEEGSDKSKSNDAMIQKKLRQELADLMKRYDDLMENRPPAFNRANRAMGRAEDALDKGNMPRAVQAEGQALDQLQSAARAVQEQMLERFSGEGALGQQLLGESGEGGRDPFGRKGGTDNKNSSEARGMTIPEESEFQRVRTIRDELRRRSGERHRPTDEIDYIDRLLQPF